MSKFKEPYVILLIGPPLSGKTTWIRNNFEEGNYKLISRDEIVMDVHGTKDYNTAFNEVDQKYVDKLLIDKLTSYSKSGENVIIDMTHMTSKRRKYNLSFFSGEYTKYAVIFPMLSSEEYELRNSKRSKEENKSIPMHVIKNMISSYQTIKDDEGFDKIITI